LESDSRESLASTKWFKDAKSAIPSNVGLAGLVDGKTSIELMWWMMKQTGKINTPVPTEALTSPIGIHPFEELIDFKLLPEFDSISKYFGLSTFYTSQIKNVVYSHKTTAATRIKMRVAAFAS
jgi:hypothetical protein